ncbi:hypothetical protein BC834DRAFT_660787 [Gloeopeniophorella convolvens]|nr:hypothetical protein BC834DRAFT_660787 [Gloeopeniophorella convolvens]
MSDTPAGPTESVEFGPPFDFPDADLVIRSSDSVTFKAYRASLEQSSPIIARILLEQLGSLTDISTNTTSASSGGDSSSALPVMRLPEDGETLHTLLTAILPVPIHLPSTFEGAIPVLVAATKYKAYNALLTLRTSINERIYVMVKPEDAFRVFCLARKSGLLREALIPVRVLLDQSIAIEGLGDKLVFATGALLHELMAIQRHIQSSLGHEISEFRVSEELGRMWRPHSETCTDRLASGAPRWVDEAITKLASHARPSLDPRDVCFPLQSHITDDCPSCEGLPTMVMTEFWNVISRVVMAAILQAEDKFISEQLASPPRVDLPFTSSGLSQEIGLSRAPHPDVILRSCDDKNLFAHRSTLAASSPFFEDMFSLPNPQTNPGEDSEDMQNGLPIIRMTEHSEIIDALLSILYPGLPPMIGSYTFVLQVLASAQKYQMKGTMDLIRSLIAAGRFPKCPADDDVLYAYVVATRHRLAQETRDIALLSLDRQLSFDAFKDALCFLEGSAAYALLQYRNRCQEAADACLDSALSGVFGAVLEFLQPIRSQPSLSRCKVPNWRQRPLWWEDFLISMQSSMRIRTKYPSIKSLGIRQSFESSLKDHVNTVPSCLMCTVILTERGAKFCAALEDDVRDAIRRVSLRDSTHSFRIA